MLWSLALFLSAVAALWALRRYRPWPEHLRIRAATVLLVVALASGFVAAVLHAHPEREGYGRWLVALATLWVCLNAALAPNAYWTRHRTGRAASDFDW